MAAGEMVIECFRQELGWIEVEKVGVDDGYGWG
jgi:hypothetical protein